jgi:hypothetical protein
VITAVDHVLLAAPPGAEDRLRAYYVGVLGMTEIPKPPALAVRGGCWFGAGAAILHLGVEPGFRPPRKAHPGPRVRGIDAYAARPAGHGVPVIAPFPAPFPGRPCRAVGDCPPPGEAS